VNGRWMCQVGAAPYPYPYGDWCYARVCVERPVYGVTSVGRGMNVNGVNGRWMSQGRASAYDDWCDAHVCARFAERPVHGVIRTIAPVNGPGVNGDRACVWVWDMHG